jgi:hypothetical protein
MCSWHTDELLKAWGTIEGGDKKKGWKRDKKCVHKGKTGNP